MATEITAQLKYFRQGPRKARLIADMIRGRNVDRAVNMLSVLNKKGARAVLKLLLSAMANAKHNHAVTGTNLRIKSITVDGGPVLKRWLPRAHGRATPIRERTSHIKLVLEEFVRKEKKVKKTETKKIKAEKK
jgi:large subunit ribosomal protein L22